MTTRALATLEEHTAHLEAYRAALTVVEQTYTAAQRAYEQEVDPLYFTPAQAQANAAQALPDLEQAEQDAAAAAAQIRANARAIMEATASEQPSLTPEEEANAGARAALIREDCETLDYPALAQAINRAILANDRPAMWLFWRYARPRLRAIDNATGPQEQAAKSTVDAAIQSIADRLTIGNVKSVYTSALDLHVKASALEDATQRRSRQEHPPQYSWMRENDQKW